MGAAEGPETPIKLFYSYSHRDEELQKKLENHLAALRRSGMITEWHDRNIDVGEEWAKEIDRNLSSADIILLLVSASFIASEYCWSVEMKKALERNDKGEAKIIPVILRPCAWHITPFAKLQAAPMDAKPVTSWSDPDEAMFDVARKIERAVIDLQQRRRAPEQAKQTASEAQTLPEGNARQAAEESPVRKNADIVAYDRNFIDQIQSEVLQLRAQRGEDLFAAAMASAAPEEKLRLLREAARINPSRADILIELGAELRKQAYFDESAAIFKQAIALDPKLFRAHRELGVTYGKMGKSELAVESLNEAVRLAPDDAETLRNAGGALRRWGLREAPARIDWDTLRIARDRYAMAGKIEPYNTYALLNVARLELLISKTEPSRLPIAIKQFHDIKALCQFNVTQDPADSWRRFDLADTYLFSGDHARAKELYLDAIKTIKNERRRSYLTAVVAPLHELLNIGALSGDLKSSVEDVAKVIDGQIRT